MCRIEVELAPAAWTRSQFYRECRSTRLNNALARCPHRVSRPFRASDQTEKFGSLCFLPCAQSAETVVRSALVETEQRKDVETQPPVP